MATLLLLGAEPVCSNETGANTRQCSQPARSSSPLPVPRTWVLLAWAAVITCR